MFDDERWAEVPAVAEAVIRLSGKTQNESLESPPKILDVCCGVGRISAELARKGFDVTGIDITENFLKTAREDAEYEKLNIEYINADVREFNRQEFFDVIINLYISFGYFSDQKDDLKVLYNAYESLKKGGSFIIETLGKEISSRDFIEAEWFERAGYTVLTEYEPLDSWTFLKNRWILLKDGKRLEKTFIQRLYSASELKALLIEAGFANIQIFGDWDESPYDHRAAKLIAVCRK